MMVHSNDGLRRSLTNMSFLPLFYCCPPRSRENCIIYPTSFHLPVVSVKLWRQVIPTSCPRGVDPGFSKATAPSQPHEGSCHLEGALPNSMSHLGASCFRREGPSCRETGDGLKLCSILPPFTDRAGVECFLLKNK